MSAAIPTIADLAATPPATRFLINTRPTPDAGPLSDAAAAKGYRPIPCPMMTVADNDVAPDLSQVTALAFTSANGVRAFAAKSGVRDLPTFAVGARTADAARAAGFDPVFTAGGDVHALTDMISSAYASAIDGGVVLHPAGVHRAGDLAAALAAKSIPCRRQVLYDAVPVKALSHEALWAIRERADEPDRVHVALFSPRTADLFETRLAEAGAEAGAGALRRLTALALSANVAGRLERAAWREVRIAATADLDAIVALLPDAAS